MKGRVIVTFTIFYVLCIILIFNINLKNAYANTHNVLVGDTEIGILQTSYMSNVTIVDIVNPSTGRNVKAVQLNAGADVPLICAANLNLKPNVGYILEFDYWSDTDDAAFDVDLFPDDLPQFNPVSRRTVQHFRQEINSSSSNMQNAGLRFFNDIVRPNPSNIYITNIQLYEKVYSSKNILVGDTEIGILQTSYTSNASIVDIVNPSSGRSVKAVQLNAGADVPLICAANLNLKPNVGYILEFDYWSDTDDAAFDVDLWPDDLPQFNPVSRRAVQHFRQEINSSSSNMQYAVLRFFNDIVRPNPSNIYITNIQLYEKIYSSKNILVGDTEIGILQTSYTSNASIVDIVNPSTGRNVKAVQLNAGADVPLISAANLNLKQNVGYILEFDYWSDTDDAAFDVDLWPDDLPQFNSVSRRAVQHFRQEINSSSSNMQYAVLRFFNDIIRPNPSNIYITNIQLYENTPEYTYEYDPAYNKLQYILKNGIRILKFIYDLNGNLLRKELLQ